MLLHMPHQHLTPVSYISHSLGGSDVHSTTEIHVYLQDLLSNQGRGKFAVWQRLDCLCEILAGGLAAPAAFINGWNYNGIELLVSEPVF